jgi:hypothetical protein
MAKHRHRPLEGAGRMSRVVRLLAQLVRLADLIRRSL